MDTDNWATCKTTASCTMPNYPDEHGVDPITKKIIACALAASNNPGSGFLEKVYENALAHELRKAGIKVEQQHGIVVRYDGVVVGEYIADLRVEDSVLVELKAVNALDEVHAAQCLNYLKGHGPPCLPAHQFRQPQG